MRDEDGKSEKTKSATGLLVALDHVQAIRDLNFRVYKEAGPMKAFVLIHLCALSDRIPVGYQSNENCTGSRGWISLGKHLAYHLDMIYHR